METVLPFEEAVITPVFFLLLFTFCPASSSEEEYSEESVTSLVGGGFVRRLLKFNLAERFLKALVLPWAELEHAPFFLNR